MVSLIKLFLLIEPLNVFARSKYLYSSTHVHALKLMFVERNEWLELGLLSQYVEHIDFFNFYKSSTASALEHVKADWTVAV